MQEQMKLLVEESARYDNFHALKFFEKLDFLMVDLVLYQ